MADARDAPSTKPTDPGRGSIEARWAPVTGLGPTDDPPPAFRRRWVAAVVCLIILIGGIALLG